MFLSKKENRILDTNLALLLSSVVSIASTVMFPSIYTGLITLALVSYGLFYFIVYANPVFIKIKQDETDLIIEKTRKWRKN